MENNFEKTGELLAKSPLDKEIIDAILENLDKMPESALNDLNDSLEKENEQLENISEIFKELDADQDARWKNLEVKQKEVADKIMDEEMNEMANGKEDNTSKN